MGDSYALREGQSLPQVAQELGFTIEQVWNHPDNAALRGARKHPHLLLPGDVIAIPDFVPKRLEARTGRVHTYRHARARVDFVAFTFRGPGDVALRSSFVLEYPDGRCEPGTLDDGIVHKQHVPDGRYRVHLPQLIGCWSSEEIEVVDGAQVDLIVAHRGIVPGATLKLSIFPRFQDDAGATPLCELMRVLDGDAARVTEVRVAWRLDGIGALAPGDARELVFHAAAGEAFAIAPPLRIRRPVEEVSRASFFTARFRDASGRALESSFLLEHPDGHVERGELSQGCVHREDVAEGTFRVHLPGLDEARWTTGELIVPGSTELVIAHRAFAADTTASVTLFEQFGDRPLCTLDARLPGGDAPGRRETRVRWDGRPAPQLGPGERRAVEALVEAGGHHVWATAPLVLRAAGEPTRIAPNSVTFTVRGGSGVPVDSPCLLVHPDGHHERARIERGSLHRSDVAEGQYRVVLPTLIEAHWEPEEIELHPDRPAPRVELVVRHAALSGRARCAVFASFREDDVLGRVELELDSATEPVETRVAWTVSGLGELRPGERRALDFTVEIDGQYVSARAPLCARAADNQSR